MLKIEMDSWVKQEKDFAQKVLKKTNEESNRILKNAKD
jgi:hypothetical protein